MKPYRAQFALVMLIVLADVGGSLLVPTITANMINLAVGGESLEKIIQQGIWMLGISVVSGGLTLLGGWMCAKLSANIGRDLRTAVYDSRFSFHRLILRHSERRP